MTMRRSIDHEEAERGEAMRVEAEEFGARFSDYNIIAAYENMGAAKKAIDALQHAGIEAAEYSLLGATVAESESHVDKAAVNVGDARVVNDWLRHAVTWGAAGAAAAVFAREGGADVLMVEKADYFGGTTAKSQGGYWIPGNHLMRGRGLADERAAALRYMARLSYPEAYDARHPQLGLAPDDYALIATFYDHAARVVERLDALGVLRSTFFPGGAGYQYMPDYYAALAENEAPYGRILSPRRPDGAPGLGDEIARQFEAAVRSRGIEVRFGQRAVRLIQDNDGAVVGVEVATANGTTQRLRARRGVVFGTGGFIHNADLRRRFLRGPVYGGCTGPAAQGDFIPLAQAVGAQLGNMQHGWWAELVFEQAVVNSAVPMNVFVPPGDAMVQVDRTGRRYVNEKFVYNERAQLHFVWDPQRAEYRNLLTFMVYDRRVAEQFAGMLPIARHRLVYATLDDLMQRDIHALSIEALTPDEAFA